MASGSRCYYLPSYGMLKFHGQWVKGALDTRSGRWTDLLALYKLLYKRGYQPVLEQLEPQPDGQLTPEQSAARLLPATKFYW
jgi:hypothetical protein